MRAGRVLSTTESATLSRSSFGKVQPSESGLLNPEQSDAIATDSSVDCRRCFYDGTKMGWGLYIVLGRYVWEMSCHSIPSVAFTSSTCDPLITSPFVWSAAAFASPGLLQQSQHFNTSEQPTPLTTRFSAGEKPQPQTWQSSSPSSRATTSGTTSPRSRRPRSSPSSSPSASSSYPSKCSAPRPTSSTPS